MKNEETAVQIPSAQALGTYGSRVLCYPEAAGTEASSTAREPVKPKCHVDSKTWSACQKDVYILQTREFS